MSFNTNTLFYGDNLEILRHLVPSESIDLVYLDPPFNSQANYNIIFKESTGEKSTAQIQAFSDFWHWDIESRRAYEYLTVSAPNEILAKLIEAMFGFLGKSDVLAYLVMIGIRLLELYRVLKSSGSIFLHCDTTASHYLKLLMDTIFGVKNFRNEIVWRRSDAHNDAKQGARHFGRVTDKILFYTKGDTYTFNTIYLPLPETTQEKWYRRLEPKTGRRFNLDNLTAAKPGGDTLYEFKGVTPPIGRFWAYSKDKMQKMWDEGRIVKTPTGKLYFKRYLDESSGVPLQNLWLDISMLRGFSSSKERLGYPTQKPIALLERIIKCASKEGDWILDPFCGCGTAVIAAEKLNRHWIGIDITWLAINLAKGRLNDMFPGIKFKIEGEPRDMGAAKELARDRYQFQWWALSLIGARPAGCANG